ncbi:ankyrin repeat protein nuc-2 [Geopyxis carbonaria]|nr:ankyrin repeat protein nuc-2 [Geopyxis carbonaria]
MKFGKTLASRQLDIPDYAASFVNYKALKKLIKSLGVGKTAFISPISPPLNDPQAALQANKATFFFRLERELEKVNAFYLQKEAELKLRLKTLSDKKDIIQSRSGTTSKVSATYITLREGFQQFEHDLSKLQQFVEINATAFSKILKKWDKSSKSRTKELYISRAVEVQPCFNREVISELSDRATTSLLELEAWAEGENIEYTQNTVTKAREQSTNDQADSDAALLNAVLSNSIPLLEEWIERLRASDKDRERATRVFLASIAEASDTSLRTFMESNIINFHAEDEINERNCLHEAAISGKLLVLETGIQHGVDVGRPDVYGRIPLHYAVMHGRLEMITLLITTNPGTIDIVDHDNFPPLIHAITHNQPDCVRQLIKSNARIDPRNERDYIPLNLACKHGFEEIIHILLQANAKVLPDAEGLYPQHLVARFGRSDQLMLLQRYGVNINEPDKLFQWTAVFHAASEGHVRCLQVLLENGAQSEIVDEKGLSALYYAAWEGHSDCMRLLSSTSSGLGVAQFLSHGPSPTSINSAHSGTVITVDSDGIPALYLPPPILPLRRYGHNFLENKTLVQLFFKETDADAIQFDHESKYPAARLTISSKSSDLIPRNLILPLNEVSRFLTFQIDSLDSFAIDFDVYPTFGSKVVARTIALSNTFYRNSGHCILPLFDSRLRAIGRLSFDFRIIQPFQGVPLEITHFATYWKATSQLNLHSSTLITGSSLAGEYIRLHIQLTADSIPVLYSLESISLAGLDIPIHCISYSQYRQIDCSGLNEQIWEQLAKTDSLPPGYSLLANSFLSLSEVLSKLPPSIHVELNVIPPSNSRDHENFNVNHYVDTILKTVFEHARALKQSCPDLTRSIVFSTSDMNISTALNWKQPNYPVFFSNCYNQTSIEEKPLGIEGICSMKDAVRFASSNNLMGLICSSDLLDLVPALVQSVKSSGLVLVAHTSLNGQLSSHVTGVDGVLRKDGVLKFEETIDM